MKFALTDKLNLHLSKFHLYNYNIYFNFKKYCLYLICVYLFIHFFIDFII